MLADGDRYVLLLGHRGASFSGLYWDGGKRFQCQVSPCRPGAAGQGQRDAASREEQNAIQMHRFDIQRAYPVVESLHTLARGPPEMGLLL